MTQRIKDPQPLLDALERAGLSQHEAGRRMGLSQSSKLNLSIHGHRDFSLHELIALAGACEVAWTSLLPAYGIPDPLTPSPELVALMKRPAIWEQQAFVAEFRKVQKDVRAIEQWISTIRQAFEGFRP